MGKDTTFSPFTLNLRHKLVTFDRPAVMGILNVTPDSFYGESRCGDVAAIRRRALQLVDEGADLIDVGCVSTRPGARLLDPDDEAVRLEAAVTAVRSVLPDVPISVDTCYSLPARRAVAAGADMINDISGGLFDGSLFDTVAELQVPYVLSHNRTTPDRMHLYTHYDDLIGEVVRFLSDRLHQLYALGVNDVWIDPGFGFSKDEDDNYRLLSALDEMTSLFREPLLVGVSRKSMIYKPLNVTPEEALHGTTVLHTIALMQGTRILRVHDPLPARQAATLVQRLYKASHTAPSNDTSPLHPL